MPAERLSMRKIKEVLRLKYTCQLSQEAIAASCGIGRTSVREYLRLAAASRYEPDINPTYHEMARHYGTAELPTRVRRPQDKAKVENGGLGIEMTIAILFGKIRKKARKSEYNQ